MTSGLSGQSHKRLLQKAKKNKYEIVTNYVTHINTISAIFQTTNVFAYIIQSFTCFMFTV